MKHQQHNNSKAVVPHTAQYVRAIMTLCVSVVGVNLLRRGIRAVTEFDLLSSPADRVIYVSVVLIVVGVNIACLARVRDRWVRLLLLACVAAIVSGYCYDVFSYPNVGGRSIRRYADPLTYTLIICILARCVMLLVDRDRQRMLGHLASETSHQVGAEFLDGLVSQVVLTRTVRAAFISEVTDDAGEETIVCSAQAPDIQHPVPLPVGETIDCSASALQERAEHRHTLVLELTDASRQVVGHFGLYCRTGRRISQGQRAALSIFAARVTAELLRSRADRRSEQMEARMLHSQKLESLGVLAGGIAHDFNNLLHAIRSYTAAAQELCPPQPKLTASFQRIEGVVEKGAGLCTRLLAYAGRATRQNSVCDMNQLVRDTVDIIRAARSECAMSLYLAPQPLYVWGDVSQLSQVLMNLLTNAADAIDQQHGEITVRTACDPDEIPIADRLQTEAGRNYIWVQVSDNGCGIHEKDLPRIFDPFYSTKGSGRGVGLAAVAGIVRDHQGDIALTSTPRVGTIFVLAIPVTERPAPPEPAPESPTPETPRELTVLVVDDDDLVRTSTRMLLETADIMVTDVAGGPEALNVCCHGGQSFDAILLDQTMPGMSGIETYHQLRKKGVDCPVILMSGFSEVEIYEDAPEIRFLSKPCSRRDLLTAVNEAVASSPVWSGPESGSEAPVHRPAT